jgi:CRISPR-associated protein Cas1
LIKRIVEISQSKSYLKVRYGQLVIGQNGKEVSTIPCEDIGVLLVDNQAVSYTHSVFIELLKCGAAVLLCGQNHHPTGMLLPLDSNSVQTERFRQQINVKEPIKKQLWKQIVQEKIKHQAKLLGKDNEYYKTLMTLRHRVKSGDTSNLEAQASKKFWPAFFGDANFRRDINGPSPNNFLNYGYMVMRAAVARALCSAGLLPALGIHHRNRYNSFCLADDLMEPFRGFVEAKVREICRGGNYDGEIDQQIKAGLLEVLYDEVEIAGFKGPLMVGLHRTCASLARCFTGEQKTIDLPKI